MEELLGIVENVIYSSPDGNFCVFRLRPDNQQALISVTVPMEAPLQGQQLELKGEWIEHPRFGHQFKASYMMVAAPTSAEGIERFLSSGAIEGVGPAIAKRLVSAFGGLTLEIIEKTPGRLKELPGIGAKTAQKIHDSYMSKAELREIMLWLEEHNVSGIYAGRIYKQYGSFAIEVLTNNPYRMVREVEGIGFMTADAIAASNGMEPDAPYRISAALGFQLHKISSSGHCCTPELPLVEAVEKGIRVSRDAVWEVLKQDLATGKLDQETVGEELLVYPDYLYQAEVDTAESLLLLQDKAEYLQVDNGAALVEKYERHHNIQLADKQREAIEAVLQHGILVLTGGPGTGKTTVVRGMLEVLEQLGLIILLGAPTGRAAKRLGEATGRKAVTVHRLLEAQGTSEGDFGRCQDDPLEADVIILDEVSMMDIVLMSHFLDAVPLGCHVILVGDVDQLPAVGPGAVLNDILRSGVIPQICLTEVFRQSEASSIVINAHAINAGRMPECMEELAGDFVFLERQDPVQVEQEILHLCQKVLPAQGYDNLDMIQVLSPMHRNVCGVESLNKQMQQVLNPPAPGKGEVNSGFRLFRLGDKVMQNRNNYDKGVFNGDIGYIADIDENKILVKYSEDLYAEYEKAEYSELQLAYCLTVHKSQGSEYPVVILPLIEGHYIMLQRNLLYTAITRAKVKVIIIGSKKALFTAVSNDKTRKRYTLLAERLAQQGI